jgi:hypothetical protein
MMGLILAGALVVGPNGNTFVQSRGDGGYNIWSNEGLTTTWDFDGWQQIRRPDGETIKVIDYGEGDPVPALPIIPLELGDE